MKSANSSIGLGFNLFPSEGNAHDNYLLPDNALISLMLHKALYLSDVTSMDLGKKYNQITS